MKKIHLNLNDVHNSECLKCSREKRRRIAPNGICSHIISVIDELPVRCVGEWTYDKIYRLFQYLGIFAQGMKDQWKGLNYIEVCSGPGRCVLRESGLEIDGTSLAILGHPRFKYINEALFIDNDRDVVKTLNKRIASIPNTRDKAHCELGDYTDTTELINLLSHLEGSFLNLVFVDPTNCNVPFSTVKAISNTLRNADFIINTAIGTDVNRNIKLALLKHSYSRVKQKYIDFLGSSDYFNNEQVINYAKSGKDKELRMLFAEAYKASFAELGYDCIDIKPVKNYYYLLFASRHKKGLEFWKKACSIDPTDQRQLPFNIFE